uniref:Uncharacterized protein n=2 Tax=Acrobeloides nanus TaxID=290746 RepID=A0A914DHK7_9BILA
MPKLGGHASRMADFFEQMTSMLGYTENLMGAWQLARKTGRLHGKVQFLAENQNQLEKNYFAVVVEVFIQEFIPYITGEKEEPVPEGGTPVDKKKVRFQQNYSNTMITEVWKKFFTLCTSQLTESFEFERAKGLNSENQKTLAPHQHVEAAERKKRLNAEKQSEPETNTTNNSNPKEEMFEDPF